MKKFSFLLLLTSLLGIATLASAVEALLTDDTIISSSVTLKKRNFGSATSLAVSPTLKTLVRFSFETLPDNLDPQTISKATLRIWVSSATKPGLILLKPIVDGSNADWQELTVTSETAPPVGGSPHNFAIDRSSAKQFVVVDVTDLVQEWIATPAKNFGMQLETLTAQASFDSKENFQTGHLPVLDVVLSSTASATTLSGYGITDAVSSDGTTAFGRSLLALADQAAAKQALGTVLPKDVQAPITVNGLVVGDGAGTLTPAISGTNYFPQKVVATLDSSTVADYSGQLLVTSNGEFWAIARSPGDPVDGAVNVNSLMYFNAATFNGAVAMNAGGASMGPFFISAPPGNYVDNAVKVKNASGGYSAICFLRDNDADNTSGVAAIGIHRNGYNTYANRLVLATNAISPGTGVHANDILFSQEEGTGSFQHARLLFDGTNHRMILYGWDETDHLSQSASNVAIESNGTLTLNSLLHCTPQSAPANPTEGDIYMSSADHHLYLHDGTGWRQLDN